MLNSSLSDQVLQPPFTQPTTNKPHETHDVNVDTTIGEVQRLSACWLRNPAWIGTFIIIYTSRLSSFLSADGSVNPPQYYYSHEEIDASCHTSGVEPPPQYTQPDIPVAPSQPINTLNLTMGVMAGMCPPCPFF